MARQPKAERYPQTAAEIMATTERRVREYRGKMLAAMDTAVRRLGWNITVAVATEQLIVSSRDGEYRVFLSLEMKENEDYARLEHFENEVCWALEELEEADRKVRVKNAALAKLTPEERKLLGI